MELTRTDDVFSRIAMVLFLCRNKSSWNDLKINGDYFWKILKILAKESTPGGPHPVHEGGGAYPLGACPALWVPWTSTDLNSNSTYSRSGRKKIREKDSSRFTVWSRHHPLFFLMRPDLESVWGFGEGKLSPSSSPTFLRHQFHDAHRRV